MPESYVSGCVGGGGGMAEESSHCSTIFDLFARSHLCSANDIIRLLRSVYNFEVRHPESVQKY